MTQKQAPISLFLSTLPILVLIGFLSLNVFFFSDNATSGPNQLALLFTAAVATVIALMHKYKWEFIQNGIVSSISSSLSAVLILLIIGALSGTWLVSGIVPSMIFYGLKILNPTYFLVTACLISAIVSIATGSSWTTTATVGVAMIAIGKAMDLNLGMVAGSIISGAYFGDKLSPLSDTTNLAPAMAGTDLFTHIRYMTYTTIPTFIATLILFVVLGFTQSNSGDVSQVDELLSLIQSKFYISPVLFLVPALVVFLIIKKVDAIPALFIGALAGGIFIPIFQGQIVNELFTGESYLQKSYTGIIQAMGSDVAVVTGNSTVDDLLQSGGMASMLNTIWLILCAMIFGGVMESTGMLSKITQSLVSFAKSTGSLIATTVGTCLTFNATASDQYLAIVVPGRMYAEEYRKRGLKPENLSRTLEDSGTVTSVLFPWNTCGAYQSGILGVMTGDYLFYCFFNYLSPITTLIYGFFNIKIRKFTEQEIQEIESIEDLE